GSPFYLFQHAAYAVIYALSLHDALPIFLLDSAMGLAVQTTLPQGFGYTTLEFKISFVRGMSQDTGTIRTEGKVLNAGRRVATARSEEHTSELQSRFDLVCRLLLEKKKKV